MKTELLIKPTTSEHDSQRIGSKINPSEPLLGKVTKVLLPVDFSELSLASLEYGAALAAQAHASLHLLHVFEPTPVIADLNGISIPVPPDDEVAADLGRRLAKVADEHATSCVSITSEVRIGYPRDEIAAVAAERCTDLIVISSHGRTGFKRLLLGSVADRLVREAPCPVLVVRSGQCSSLSKMAAAGPAPVQKILVPTDLSRHSLEAFDYAEGLARQCGAIITLVHFFPIFDAAGYSDFVPSDSSPLVVAARKAAERQLERVIRTRAQANVLAEPVVVSGPLLAEIPVFARNGGFDLIVCTTHGFAGFQRALFGSTAEDLMHGAPCPVLVVRTHTADSSGKDRPALPNSVSTTAVK